MIFVDTGAWYADFVSDGKAGLEPLVAALRKEDSMMRTYAAEALGKMGSISLTRLTRLLEDPDPLLRSGAALSLSEMGRSAGPPGPALRERLQDQDEGVREAARTALKRIDPAR